MTCSFCCHQPLLGSPAENNAGNGLHLPVARSHQDATATMYSMYMYVYVRRNTIARRVSSSFSCNENDDTRTRNLLLLLGSSSSYIELPIGARKNCHEGMYEYMDMDIWIYGYMDIWIYELAISFIPAHTPDQPIGMRRVCAWRFRLVPGHPLLEALQATPRFHPLGSGLPVSTRNLSKNTPI